MFTNLPRPIELPSFADEEQNQVERNRSGAASRLVHLAWIVRRELIWIDDHER